MSTTLYLKKMGCDFFKNDTSTKASDVSNYRVRVAYRNKKGDLVHGDFSRLPFNNTITTDLQVGHFRHLIKLACSLKAGRTAVRLLQWIICWCILIKTENLNRLSKSIRMICGFRMTFSRL